MNFQYTLNFVRPIFFAYITDCSLILPICSYPMMPAGTLYNLLLLLLLWVGRVGSWQLVLKVPQGGDLGGSGSVYDLWVSDHSLNADMDNPMSAQPGAPYKSASMLDWDNSSISLVCLHACVLMHSCVSECVHIYMHGCVSVCMRASDCQTIFYP